jgi:tetratricopeptide (TPR) repeat protein
MAEVTIDEVPRKTREVFEKAVSAMERGNADYATDMLLAILDTEPRFLQARRLLRAAQLKKRRDSGGGSMHQLTASLSGIGGVMAVSANLKSKPLKALQAAERLMMKDPLNKQFYTLLAKAALAADMPEVAIHTLEIIRETAPDDIDLLYWIGGLYKENGITDKARECFERIGALRPNDPKAIKALKDSQAMDTMKSGRWNEAAGEVGGYRKVMKNAEEAQRLEQEAKAVKTTGDTEALLADQLRKIEREPNNINYRRALGDLYARAGRLEEALAALTEADRISGGGDPQIDRAISGLRVRMHDARIEALRAGGDETGATAAEQEKQAFLLSDAEDRVKRYPNDLQCKYDLGILLFERDRHAEAIQQFQQSQRNPQRRIRSLYYLARCFEKKGQFDIAAEQLEKAASELTVLDNMKKDILYELGVVYDQMEQRDKAVELFKLIYAVDIGYRDVAARIEASYKTEKG